MNELHYKHIKMVRVLLCNARYIL